jgi:hypothetical protein
VLLLQRRGQPSSCSWFPLFFMIFMIPLPGVFVDARHASP